MFAYKIQFLLTNTTVKENEKKVCYFLLHTHFFLSFFSSSRIRHYSFIVHIRFVGSIRCEYGRSSGISKLVTVIKTPTMKIIIAFYMTMLKEKLSHYKYYFFFLSFILCSIPRRLCYMYVRVRTPRIFRLCVLHVYRMPFDEGRILALDCCGNSIPTFLRYSMCAALNILFLNQSFRYSTFSIFAQTPLPFSVYKYK